MKVILNPDTLDQLILTRHDQEKIRIEVLMDGLRMSLLVDRLQLRHAAELV